MSASFTPGPWMAPPYSSVVGMGIVGPRGRIICSIAIAPGFNPNGPHEAKREIEYADEVRANARLIAAAPELHRALTKLSIAAQTSGGVAGRDEALVAAIEEAERVLALTNVSSRAK